MGSALRSDPVGERLDLPSLGVRFGLGAWGDGRLCGTRANFALVAFGVLVSREGIGLFARPVVTVEVGASTAPFRRICLNSM